MLVTLLGIVMEVKAHPRKAHPPMVTKLLGVLIEERLEQSLKAPLPIVVTFFPSLTEVRPLQPEYLEVIDYQLFVVNTVEKWIGFYLWVYGK